MESHFSLELPHAVVVAEDNIKKLSELLSDRIGAIKITTECADNVTRTFLTVKDLLGYENVKSRQVRRLKLSARSDDYKKSAEINIGGTWLRGISLDFTARDDVVSRLRSDTLDVFEGMRPWYGVFHRVNFFAVVSLGLLAVPIGAVMVFGALAWPNRIKVESTGKANPRGDLVAASLMWGVIAVLFGGAAILTYFRDRFFPRAVFLIGKGKDRFANLERLQWSVVVGFCVSLLAGLIIAAFQAFGK